MGARIAADLLLLIHFGFILFVLLGGVLVIQWTKLAWLHLPCVAWGIWIESSGGICPLTSLENHFRVLAGTGPYSGSFIEHYLLPLIYPAGLTRNIQLLLALIVIALNSLFYLMVIFKKIRSGAS